MSVGMAHSIGMGGSGQARQAERETERTRKAFMLR